MSRLKQVTIAFVVVMLLTACGGWLDSLRAWRVRNTSVTIPTGAPTGLPEPEPLLRPGMEVVVQTLGGEVLYLRAQPSTGAEIVRHLYDDMRLTLLEGPVTAEGYVWWRVRVEEDGSEGWAAEAVDISTLIPYRPLPESTAEATPAR